MPSSPSLIRLEVSDLIAKANIRHGARAATVPLMDVQRDPLLVCRFVQESLHRNPPRSVSICPPRVIKPLPQLHQVHPRSHHQSADADLSRHQVGHC